MLVRPLLDIPKARLIATLAGREIAFADDPSNRDPRFTRARLRGLMPALARRRSRRPPAGAAGAPAAARRRGARGRGRPRPTAELVATSPRRRADRLRRRAALRDCRPRSRCACSAARSTRLGDEGPVELGKLEALECGARCRANAGNSAFRRSLAGAMVTLGGRPNHGRTGPAAARREDP